MFTGIECIDAHPLLEIKTIGNSTFDSVSQWNNDTLLLSGRSKGMSDTSDNCIFAYNRLSGDIDLSASFINYGTDQNEAGLMLREDTTAGSRCIQFVNNKKNGLYIRYRLQNSGAYVTVPVKANNSECIRITRVGDLFAFFWKMKGENQWRSVSPVYTILFSTSLLSGMCQSSYNESVVSGSKFFNISGIPEEQTSCIPLLWNFNTPNIDSTKLDQFTYWTLINNYMKTATVGGSKKSILSTNPIFVSRTDSLLTLTWQSYYDRDTTPELSSYSLFGKDSVIIRERMGVVGGSICSGGKLEIGMDSRVKDLFANGSIYLKDRAVINGNVTCMGSVTRGSLVTVTGLIRTNTSVYIPTIPTRTVSVGTTIKYVDPNDSIYLAPGKYKDLTIYANAKIRFSSGVYQFSSLYLNPDVKFYLPVSIDSTIEINVKETLKFADRFKMILTDSTLWRNVSFYTNQSAIVYMSTDMKLSGYFYMPNAKVILYSRTLSLNGGIYAKSVHAEPDFNIAMTAAGESSDILETVFKNYDSGQDYRLFQKFNRESINNYKDFVLLYGNDTIGSGTTGKLTPCRKWITTTCEFYKERDLNGNGKVRILFNDGNGNVCPVDTVNDNVKNISDITMNYSTGIGSRCKQIGVDSISVSCNTACTPIVIISPRQPLVTTAIKGEDARLSFVTTSGTACTFQWFRNNVIMSGQTSSLLVLRNLQLIDSGTQYYCTAKNMCDSAQSDNFILNVVPCENPVIYTQPVSVVREPGMSADFDVVAYGVGLTYQWKHNNSDIKWQTANSLTLNNLSMENNHDEITVKITNRCGKQVLSDTAIIHMIEASPCTLDISLQSDTLEVGDYYFGEVRATCAGSLYSWLRNGTLINQTTDNVFIYGPVAPDDSGKVFTCVVTNGARSDTSSPAILTVIQPKKGNRLVTISGRLLNGVNENVGENSREIHEFMVKLFKSVTGGTEVYTEKFIRGKRIVVDSGYFTIHLGRGETTHNLQNVFASNANVFAEIYAGDSSHFELTGPRLAVSAVPYSFSSGVKEIFGNGSPVTNNVNAPLGTMYIDKSVGNKTWKMLQSGWKRLD